MSYMASILDHTSATTTTHKCGGTILYSAANGEPQIYCDRCGAFTHDPAAVEAGDLPTGTDPEANQQALEDGEESSPDA